VAFGIVAAKVEEDVTAAGSGVVGVMAKD